MNYRELLVRYMMKVIDCEGCDYIGNWAPYVALSDVETSELNAICDEARKRLAQ